MTDELQKLIESKTVVTADWTGNFYYMLYKSDVIELVEKLTKWNKVEDKPLCYKSGNWDGLMSDQILVKTKEDVVLTAIAYGGRMDGFEFLEFYDMNDFEVKDVTEWKPII